MNPEQEKIVNLIIEQIGKEEDRPAYGEIARAFSQDIVLIADTLYEAQKRMKGKPPEVIRRYFMGMLKNRARERGIRVFKKWER